MNEIVEIVPCSCRNLNHSVVLEYFYIPDDPTETDEKRIEEMSFRHLYVGLDYRAGRILPDFYTICHFWKWDEIKGFLRESLLYRLCQSVLYLFKSKTYRKNKLENFINVCHCFSISPGNIHLPKAINFVNQISDSPAEMIPDYILHGELYDYWLCLESIPIDIPEEKYISLDIVPIPKNSKKHIFRLWHFLRILFPSRRNKYDKIELSKKDVSVLKAYLQKLSYPKTST